jgi:hypothetical protein
MKLSIKCYFIWKISQREMYKVYSVNLWLWTNSFDSFRMYEENRKEPQQEFSFKIKEHFLKLELKRGLLIYFFFDRNLNSMGNLS